jgi:hypothetical protein
MTSAGAGDHLDHCNLTLRILQVGSVHHSWEIEIDDHFDDSLRRDYESDCGGSRNVGCDEGCESGVWVNEIFPSVDCQLYAVAWLA